MADQIGSIAAGLQGDIKFEPEQDFNSKYEPTHSGVLEHRPMEPKDVATLKERARLLLCLN